VEVGAQLYEVDTEAEATVAPADLVEASGFPPPSSSLAPTTTAAVEEASPSVAATEAEDTAAPKLRVPSIHFLQKEGWSKRKAGHEAEGATTAAAASEPPPPPAAPVSPLAVTTYSVDSLPPMYGRPKFTPAEMDALVYGGANLLDA
jgi:hypothetical protein